MNMRLAVLGVALATTCAAGTANAHHGGGGSTSSSNAPIVYHPVHGPGSSHNPILYRPLHGPGSTHNPILRTAPIVRDHRNHGGVHGGGMNGGAPSPEGGVVVTSGSGRNKVVVPTHLGDYPVYAIPGNGLYNGPPAFSPIVRDHR